jgi:pSer/pThr/pTyr-binding forkhead associated (FHA) protein
MKLSLVVMTPGNKMEGKVLEIKLAQFVVGRDPQCHLRPASPLISKRHCALLQRDGKVFVRDFGSTNGTFVNEEPVKGEVEVRHEDKLKIGPLLFSVRIEQEAPAAKKSLTPPPPTRPSTRTVKQVSAPLPDSGAAATPAAAAAPESVAAETASNQVLATTETNTDDDVAALLLSLQDDGNGGSAEVPEGSTVHDLSVSPDVLAAADPTKAGQDPKGKKDLMAQAKLNTANTSAAAEAILKKYTRRPRKDAGGPPAGGK